MFSFFNSRNFMRLNRTSPKLSMKQSILKLTQFNVMNFRPTNTLYAKDYYKTLGVPRNASKAEIKKAYFRGAK